MPAIVFIDSRVPEQALLLQGLPPSTRVVGIHAGTPGWAQLRMALRDETDLDAIHIVCHGAEGTLLLGALPLHAGNLHAHAAELQAIGSSLAPGAGLLLYGCEVAGGVQGRAFVSALAAATGAAVAASRTTVGHPSLGGQWQLGEHTAPVHVPPLVSPGARQAWTNVLAVTSTVQLSALDGANGLRLSGHGTDSRTGFSVSDAGDVNGDGFDDLVVGAYDAMVDGNRTGASYVVFGKASGFTSNLQLSALNGTDGFQLAGVAGGDRSGFAVSAAGDVNGDGFADVVVGAQSASPSSMQYAGASYVVFGSASGFPSRLDLSALDGTTGFRLAGADAFDRSGFAVSEAGDINGDGFGDLVIGARDASPSGVPAGASFVVFGKASGFAASLDLSGLNGANGFQIAGAAAANQAGGAVSGAGDVNGDGFDDLFVASPNAGAGYSGAGYSHIVFGRSFWFASSLNLGTLNGFTGFRISGNPSERTGTSLANAGDVNGDGIDDMIIGAPSSGAFAVGASYVVFGQSTGFGANLDLSTLNGSNGFRIVGTAINDQAGQSVSGAGDVNGDGYDDLLVGSYKAATNGNDAGASYVIYGKSAAFASSLQVSALDGTNGFRILGKDANDRSGRSVSAAGDVNGDGFDDLLIGADGVDATVYASNAGASYVVFGGNFTEATIQLGLANADALGGSTAADIFVAGQGNDTLTGGGGADAFNAGAGNDRIDVSSLDFRRVDGGTGSDTLALSGSGLMLDLTVRPDNRIQGVEIIDITGTGPNTLKLTVRDVIALSGTTNTLRVDADAGDRLISAETWTAAGTTSINSQTYAVFTRDGATLQLHPGLGFQQAEASLPLSALNGTNGFVLDGVAAGDQAGRAVAGAGDVNGDGFDDLIIGAQNATTNGTYAGASYVVFGKAGGFAAALNLSSLDGSSGFRISGEAAFDLSGLAVHAAGDVNGDGFADLLAGAPGSDVLGSLTGAAYVIFGKATGYSSNLDLSTLNGANGFRLVGATPQDLAGVAVSGGGDVNGDGFDDLLIGSSGGSAYQPNSGESFVFYGKASGFDASFALSAINGSNGARMIGVGANDQSGAAVANAGDVNNDGLDDLFIGASRADPNGTSSGAGYVVFGQASGLASRFFLSSLDGTNGFRLNGVAFENYAGYSVSAAGDINGDGVDDLAIGARGADPVLFNEGATYVIFGKVSGWTSSLQLNALDGTNGFRIAGRTDSEAVGSSVGGAGDVNGDGYDDLIVGASQAGAGSAYVVFGKAGGFSSSLSVSVLDGTNGYQLLGATNGDLAGASVQGAGDVNGDGFADLVIGSPGADVNGSAAGGAQVVFGGLTSDAVTYLGGAGADSFTGTSQTETFVSGQGNDTLQGGGGADSFRAGAGNDRIVVNATAAFRLVDGGAGTDTLALDGAGLNLDLRALTRKAIQDIEVIDLTGSGDNTLRFEFGEVLDATGVARTLRVDGNAGDRAISFGWTRVADEQVGPDTYRAYTLGLAKLLVDPDVGFSNPQSSLALSSLDGNNGMKVSGVAANDASGTSVSGIGDFNGDGFADFIVGAENARPNGSYSGAAYVVFGKADGFTSNLNLSALDGSNGFRLNGVDAFDFLGGDVGGTGDVNGDGFTDVLVGARNAEGTGAAYLVFGRSGGFTSALNVSALSGLDGFALRGASGNDQAGGSVAIAGDINGDGFDDMLVGMPASNTYTGAAVLVFGKASGFAATVDLSALGSSAGFRMAGLDAYDGAGGAVSSAGDINGDGLTDMVIGARGADAGSTDAGATYVVFGKATGWGTGLSLSALNGTDGFRLSGAASADLSGFSVSSAGDINGDGFDDLVIGARYVDAGVYTANVGAAYVLFGKSGGFAGDLNLSGLDGTNGFALQGVGSSDAAGSSVSGAGDINGDGWDDLLVGAPSADVNGSNAGAAYVILGKASGFASRWDLSALDGNNGYRMVGASAQDRIGTAVTGAGDLNGDGYDDMVVSSPNVNANGAASGASYVIFGANNQGTVTRAGSAGGDQLTGTSLGDVIAAGSGNDNVLGLAGNDLIRLGAGNDSAEGDTGNDRIDGDSGNDNLGGGDGFDALDGGIGNDVLRGGINADTLRGGAGNDLLNGGKGTDFLQGGTGSDTLVGALGNDLLHGGEGIDTADYSASTDAVTVTLLLTTAQLVSVGTGLDTLLQIENLIGSALGDNLTGSTGNNTLSGGNGNDTLSGDTGFDSLDGGDGNDSLAGGLNADTVVGGIGNDFVGGGQGTDSLLGGDGDDTLVGGLGTDRLMGGAGADRYVFRHALDGAINIDTLADLETGVDVVELSVSIFAALQPSLGSKVGTSANLLYNNVTGVLAYDADGAGALSPVSFAIVGSGTHPATLGNDFLIVA